MLPCKCCGNYTVVNEHDICPVCFWQRDFLAESDETKPLGPNRLSLVKARKNYQQFGASEQRFISVVRKPKLKELPEFHKRI